MKTIMKHSLFLVSTVGLLCTSGYAIGGACQSPNWIYTWYFVNNITPTPVGAIGAGGITVAYGGGRRGTIIFAPATTRLQVPSMFRGLQAISS